MHGRDEKFIKNLVGRPEGKRLFGRPRRGWLRKRTRVSSGNSNEHLDSIIGGKFLDQLSDY
jgi:hypothetical protein